VPRSRQALALHNQGRPGEAVSLYREVLAREPLNSDALHLMGLAMATLGGRAARGKPVPDWRWLIERDDSPWYPTMRLFSSAVRRETGRKVFEARSGRARGHIEFKPWPPRRRPAGRIRERNPTPSYTHRGSPGASKPGWGSSQGRRKTYCSPSR